MFVPARLGFPRSWINRIYQYSLLHLCRKVAEVSKKWLSMTYTYGVEIADGHNDILILVVAIAIDMMSYDEGKKRK